MGIRLLPEELVDFTVLCEWDDLGKKDGKSEIEK